MVEDSVHGAIRITSEEYVLLQTPFLRRLHEIKQLGLAYLVFPTATHSRLEHSLGVTHLMHRIVSRVVAKAGADPQLCSAISSSCSARELSVFVDVSRLAALIHDSGHLAFSHATEEALADLIKRCSSRRSHSSNACKAVKQLEREAERLGSSFKIHEVYTLHLVEKMAEAVRGESEELSLKILAALETLKSTSVEKNEETWESLGLRRGALKLVSSLLSNEIYDVDRVDYLVRDARYTGVVYGYIDLDRLIEGLEVVVRNEEPEVQVTPKALQSIEDVFDARFKMYRSVYFHHKLLSIQLAVSKTLEYILEEWDSLNPQIYEHLPDPASLLAPSKLAELVSDGLLYFDDNEMMYVIKLSAMRGSRLLKRWARSLLHERHLLPVSLIKRTEELLEDRIAPSLNLDEALSKLDFEHLSESLAEIVARQLGVERSDVEVYFSLRRIVDPNAVKGFELTQYLRAVSRAASTPILQVYAFSDDERVQRTLYSHRWLLREKCRELMLEELLSYWRG
ncbi:MAG: HD domain-containing protein [Acidilobaceae archaeon]